MAVSKIGTTTSGTSAAGTTSSFVTTFPAGWAADDVAVMFGHVSATSLTMATPAGWTAIPGVTWPVNQGTLSRMYGWYRVLQAGDTAPTITNSGATTGGWETTVFRDADLVNPIGLASTATAAAATSVTLPTLATVLAGSALVSSVHARVATGTIPTGITWNAAYTESVDVATSRATTSANVRFAGATRLIASAGSYGGEAATVTNSIASSMIAALVEIEAAATLTSVSDDDTGAGTDGTATLAVDLAPATDTSSMVDAATLTTLTSKSDSDVGSGTDGTATLAATLAPATDARTATDAGTMAVTLTPATDARTATDAGTMAVTLTPATDTSSMVDAATLTTLTDKAGSDTASLTESATIATLTAKAGSDTATGTEGTATLSAALTPAADARTAVDAGTVGVTLSPAADARTAVDAGTLGVTLTPATDLRTVVDAGILLASFTGTDLGGSADAPSGPLSATLTGAEAAGRVEAYQLSVVLQSADTGAGADAGSVLQGTIDKSGADTAAAVDAANLAASQTRADTAGAADVATLVVNFTASELSSIVDTVQALAAAHQDADASNQTDEDFSLSAGGQTSSSDTGKATEGRTLSVQLTGADSSTHTENQTVSQGANVASSDTSSATENRTLAVQLTASEIVTAIENFTLSAGSNQAGTDTSAMAELIQLTVQVIGADGVATTETGELVLVKVGDDTSTLVDSEALLAEITVAEIYAAAEVLALLTGPHKWDFISADLRALSSTEMSGTAATELTGTSGATSSGVTDGGTSISMTISF